MFLLFFLFGFFGYKIWLEFFCNFLGIIELNFRSFFFCYLFNDIVYLFLYIVVSCGDLGFLVNGFRIGDKFIYEEWVIYDCDVGYKF